MVPKALSKANRPDTGSISLCKKYNGTSGMPNQPVAKIPVKANVMNSQRARSLYKRLKDLVCQETLAEALDWWIAGLSILDSVLLFLASSNLNTKSWFLLLQRLESGHIIYYYTGWWDQTINQLVDLDTSRLVYYYRTSLSRGRKSRCGVGWVTIGHEISSSRKTYLACYKSSSIPRGPVV